MTGGLLLRLGSATSPYGDALVLFSPSVVANEAKEACPNVSWARDAVKRCGDGIFRALGFEKQVFKTGVTQGPIYRANELKVSRMNRILSLDELIADLVAIRWR
jgi:hypothetical protein